MFQAKVVLDSRTIYGVRALTFELTYPLPVHNEFLTHRANGRSDDRTYDEWLEFSRNSSSNRALPTERIIQAVIDDPYIPLRFGARKATMYAGDDLDAHESRYQRENWLLARDDMVGRAKSAARGMRGDGRGLHKQWVNRLLGPFQWITTVATANEEMWQHFFDLRNHHTAADEMQHIAKMAQHEYELSRPQTLRDGEWHLPYITKDDVLWATANVYESELMCESGLIYLSVARCARTSYLRQGEKVDVRDDVRLYGDLVHPKDGKPHHSPLEHQLQASAPTIRSGNVYGFLQYRKMIEDVDRRAAIAAST